MGARAWDPCWFLAVVVVLQVTAVWRAGGATAPPEGCLRRCGGVDVPYPFGMEDDVDESCYLGMGFRLRCKESFDPPKPFQGDTEVISISLSSARITILLNLSYDCYDGRNDDEGTWDTSLAYPYTFSPEENVFTAVGCDTLANFSIGGHNYGGCISGCNSLADAADGSCTGVGCCQGSIPRGVDKYVTGFIYRSKTSNTSSFNPCSYSFISQKGNYTFSTSDLKNMNQQRLFPVVLDFAIDTKTCQEAKANISTYACVSNNSECAPSASGNGYVCNCSQGYEGNPYIADGCRDIDECGKPGMYPCYGTCKNVPGNYICTCPPGTSGVDATKNGSCLPVVEPRVGKLPLATKLILGIGTGILLVLLMGAACGLEFQRRKMNRMREEHFSNHGGSYLQDLLARDASNFKIFSLADLHKATNGFHSDQVLGTGGFGTVYKGTLDDRRSVAIKRAKDSSEKNGREFANELFVLSKVNHKNIVELLGCCLEDKAPILVYKFIPNGTLYDFLHGENRRRIPFATRLRIAAEAAEALRYLHIEASTPILHGDVKSMNILLDEGHVAKIADFGTSRLSPKDQKQFTTMVQGTYGYLDPEYVVNGHLSDKSDVYSFGVVLVELLTGRVPVSFDAVSKEVRSVASRFVSCMVSGTTPEILDPEIVAEGGGAATEVVKVVADIAMRCLSVKGEERPTMGEVAAELGGCRVPAAEWHPWAPSEHEDTAPLFVRSPSDAEPMMRNTSMSSSIEFAPRNQTVLEIGRGR